MGGASARGMVVRAGCIAPYLAAATLGQPRLSPDQPTVYQCMSTVPLGESSKIWALVEIRSHLGTARMPLWLHSVSTSCGLTSAEVGQAVANKLTGFPYVLMCTRR